jgi:ATP-dependent exoDNAse (exonuclease V) beta subunit
MIKRNEKFKYIEGKQLTDHETGTRVYEVVGTKLPSVTTILGATKDQEFLKKWKAKVGEAKAEEIKNLSSRRGTAMHKYLECYIESKGYEDLTDIGVQAKPMAQKIIDIGLAPVDEYYGSEVTLYYPGLYAGSTDLVCRHNGMDTIIDFKQANKPKNKDWIEDYYLQIAAYCMAHDYVYGSQIQQGIIMVCTPDLYFQEFKFQDHELRQWKHKFLKRFRHVS